MPGKTPVTLKVMADYDCFPLWQASRTGPDNVDPRALPIPEELAERLLDWSATYDSTLNRSDPRRSGFADDSARAAFVDDGATLAHALAVARPDNTIEYFDEATGLVTTVS